MNLSLRSIAFFILIFTTQLNAQNTVAPGAVRLDATFENISVYLDISGDDNLNSTLAIRYKETGASAYLNGAMTMRAHPGLIIDGQTTSRNFHAGSAMSLQPGMSYDIELNLSDPDGGGAILNQTISTNEIPEPPSNGTLKYVAPGNGGGNGSAQSPYLGLQAAADNANPGDILMVAEGSYEAFTLLTSGTAGNPITFLSEVPRAAIIDGQDTDRGIVTLGEFSITLSHVIIDGFSIENGKWGIDAQNTKNITVRNNIIQDVDYGYVNRRDTGQESDQYITNNLILGNTVWPQSGIPSERGVDIRGNNNVVSFNTIKNFGDGVSTDGPPYEVSYSLDVHNNNIANIVDDLLEIDGIISNARVYANQCFNGRAGVSIAPIYGGPAYVFRNVLFNMENSAFKMNRGPSGMVIVHNTTASDQNAVESPDGWQNTFYRNNIMLSTRYCFELFGLEPDSEDDWDYGAYYSTRTGVSGTEWFKWNNVRYANVPILQASNILETNAIEVAIADFENAALPDPFPVEYDASERNFMPLQTASVLNSGASLLNINNGFVSDGAPDRGALEFGETVPYYGHNFDLGTHILMADDSIEIFPNPFTDKVVLDGDFANFTIQVYDALGQLVSDHSSASAPFTIDLTSLGAGIYFVNVSSVLHANLNVYKIIKE